MPRNSAQNQGNPEENAPEELDAAIAAKKEELAKVEAELADKRETLTKTEMVQTETGLIVPKTTVLTKQKFVARKYDSKSWAVYAENGSIRKIYSEKDGTSPEDCERAAKNLAAKLSNQFV